MRIPPKRSFQNKRSLSVENHSYNLHTVSRRKLQFGAGFAASTNDKQINTKWLYVLSTMGVSKESISKFLIGNRFHVKLRIRSSYVIACLCTGLLVMLQLQAKCVFVHSKSLYSQITRRRGIQITN